MSDEVRAVAKEILDRTEGQIGTHSTDCHKYHLACFAAFVADALEAAQQTPVTINGRTVTYNEEDGYWWAESEGAPGWTAVANSRQELDVLTNEAKGLVEVAVDREALARALDPWAWHTGDPSNGAVQVSRAESLAKAQTIIARLSASGIPLDAAEVEARGLERYADERWGAVGPNRIELNAMYDEELRMRARAQQLRESGNSNPKPHAPGRES